MSIKNQVDVLTKGRVLMLKLIEDLTLAQINKIPQGFNNNIGWNIGHLVVTQQLLCYKLSNLPCAISQEMIDRYKKGTAPSGYVIEKEEWTLIKKLFLQLPKQLLKDYENSLFTSYNVYTTSVDVVLDNIKKAIDFNNFHEGIHVGVVLAIKKLVK